MIGKNYEKVIKLIIDNPDLTLEELSLLSNIPEEIIKTVIVEILDFYQLQEGQYLN